MNARIAQRPGEVGAVWGARVFRSSRIDHTMVYSVSLRVLHVVTSLEPEVGSIAISLRGLFRPLATAGVSSAVLVARPAPAELEGAAVHLATRQEAADRVANADVIHFHGYDWRLVQLLRPALRAAAKPYVVSPLGALGPNPRQKARWSERLRSWVADRRFCRGAARVAVLGDRERTDVLRRGITDRVRVLPYGIEMKETQPARLTPGSCDVAPNRRQMLMLCPIDPVEGIVPMLRAVAELGHDFRGWSVTLAGPERAQWRSQLEAAVHRKGFSDRIEFVVNPDERQQQACLDEASFLAAPSFCVRPPVSVFQAIAAGVPVLASDHGLPPGLAAHTMVCEPARDRLRETARALIGKSQSERVAMARGACEFARANLEWPALAPHYVSLYSEAAEV